MNFLEALRGLFVSATFILLWFSTNPELPRYQLLFFVGVSVILLWLPLSRWSVADPFITNRWVIEEYHGKFVLYPVDDPRKCSRFETFVAAFDAYLVLRPNEDEIYLDIKFETSEEKEKINDGCS